MIQPSKKVYHKTIIKTAKLAKYQDGTFGIIIKFPYDKYTIEQVKTIPNRDYDKQNNFWFCPLTIEAIEKLIFFKFVLDEKIISYYNKSKLNKIPKLSPEGLKKELRDFQKTGVGFVEIHNGRALIGDDCGLGKTVQSLAYKQLHLDLKPVIIFCTKSTKWNLAYECDQWLSSCDVSVLSGKPDRNLLSEDINIINYDILANDFEEIFTKKGNKVRREIPNSGWVDLLLELNPKLCIYDECQKIKNETAERTKAALSIGRKSPHIIGLSGTPIENQPDDIFNIVNLINPHLFKSKWHFKERYCNPKFNGFAKVYKGSSNEEELNQILQNVMIRRLKTDVLKELPDKTFTFVPLELDNREEYDFAKMDFISFIENKALEEFAEHKNEVKKLLKSKLNFEFQELLKEEQEIFVTDKVNRSTRAEELSRRNHLTQLSSKGKMKNVISWINDFLETKEKLVVFAKYKSTIDSLMEEFKKIAVKIDGRVTNDKERQKAVIDFQTNPKVRLIVISEAAAEGITLTAACNIAVLELPHHPAKLKQIVDRLHRIGQNRNVIVHFLMAINSIEMQQAKIIDEKKLLSDKILDGKVTKQEDLILELVQSFKTNEKLKVIKNKQLKLF